MLLACVPFVFHFNPDWRWVYVVAVSRASSPIVAAPETPCVTQAVQLAFRCKPGGHSVPCAPTLLAHFQST